MVWMRAACLGFMAVGYRKLPTQLQSYALNALALVCSEHSHLQIAHCKLYQMAASSRLLECIVKDTENMGSIPDHSSIQGKL